MSLTVYTVEQSEQWDNVVSSFKEYDVYWLNGYVKAFRIHGDGEPLLFYYDDGVTRGINAVMKRDIADDDIFKGNLARTLLVVESMECTAKTDPHKCDYVPAGWRAGWKDLEMERTVVCRRIECRN